MSLDFHKLYAPYISDGRLKRMKPHEEQQFLEHVTRVTTILEEVERTMLKQQISQSLKCKSSRKTEWVFLTVNFDPSKAFEECFATGNKLGNRKIWEWSYWVHEQRSEEAATAGSGHHMHLLAKISPKCVNAKTRAKAACCQVCQVSNSAIWHWRYIPEDYVLDKLAYITEPKALEKQAKQVIDKMWREANNILSLYENGIPPKKECATTTTTEAGNGVPQSGGQADPTSSPTTT